MKKVKYAIYRDGDPNKVIILKGKKGNNIPYREVVRVARFLEFQGLVENCNVGKIAIASAIEKYRGNYSVVTNKKDANKIIINFISSGLIKNAHYPAVKTESFKPKVKPKTTYRQRAIVFYESDGWRKLRYEALKFYGRRCMCCGASPSIDNKIVLHVDHIKPRSKFPELELDINNLQILCVDCNLGKSNRDAIDYREEKIFQNNI